MEYYLVNIDELLVKEGINEYSFINEMYPAISEKYSKLYFLKNFSKITNSNKDNLIDRLQNNINIYLERCSLPNKVLLIKVKDLYMEPLSKKLFKINGNLELTTEQEANRYLKRNKNNNHFIRNINNFKSITLAKSQKIK